ncbi:hypothetical protein GCM10023194_81150 [Planotetraspora phitsanulokensis]|uniref:Helix-turn-helix domain-containing protein n=1 Tax=Planotetraspora phitsanulokensis TaxID=575192 RepID=A0A8J3UDP9_9ACTN|nr:helix-turn-helix domain-containing protein [Planotetraspora phitsanulokensis]GII42962.1 hypothetical protein Pph01_79650 [Planotetraspora phitsanulokensis]
MGGKRVSGAERVRLAAELRRRYELGESIRELVVWSGRSFGLVRELLLESRASMRSRGGARPGRRKKAAAE